MKKIRIIAVLLLLAYFIYSNFFYSNTQVIEYTDFSKELRDSMKANPFIYKLNPYRKWNIKGYVDDTVIISYINNIKDTSVIGKANYYHVGKIDVKGMSEPAGWGWFYFHIIPYKATKGHIRIEHKIE